MWLRLPFVEVFELIWWKCKFLSTPTIMGNFIRIWSTFFPPLKGSFIFDLLNLFRKIIHYTCRIAGWALFCSFFCTQSFSLSLFWFKNITKPRNATFVFSGLCLVFSRGGIHRTFQGDSYSMNSSPQGVLNPPSSYCQALLSFLLTIFA